MLRTLFIGSLLMVSGVTQASPVEPQGGAPAQSQDSTPEPRKESAAELRIQQIESARSEKEANLRPEAEPSLQHDIRWVQSSFVYKLMNSEVDGFGVGFGGIGASAGLSIGPQYSRKDLLGGRLAVKIGASGSIRKSYKGGVKLSFHDLAGGHAFVDFNAAQRSLSEMPYYGAGPDSEKSGRSDYRLDDTTVALRPGLIFFHHLRAGGDAAYLKVNVGPGHSTRFISAERRYSPDSAPGIDRQTEFWRGGGFLEFDWRDRDWAPTSGGKYSAEYVRYLDRNLDRFSWIRLNFDAAQYLPLVNHTRVIALHAATSLTKTNGTQQVPFYLQPTLGGAESLRGYRSFRFYGNNSVLVNAEYRWEISPTASLLAFADAGRVFDRWAQWNLHDAESDVGFGFAFRTETKVVFRVDTGFSHEGVQVWFRANNIF